MEKEHPALEYCRNDLENFRRRLAALKNNSLKVGNSVDGSSWTNKNKEEIAYAEAKIAELTKILEASGV